MRSITKRFTSKDLNKEFKKTDLFKVRLLLGQVIIEEITNIIITKSQEFWITINKRYIYTFRFYKDFVYYY